MLVTKQKENALGEKNALKNVVEGRATCAKIPRFCFSVRDAATENYESVSRRIELVKCARRFA